MARRTRVNVFGLSFLDAMTCGFGALVLFFMIINASAGRRAGKLSADLDGEVDRLEAEVLEGHRNLVEARNTTREIENERVEAHGLSRRVIEQIVAIRLELATFDQSTVAQREHVNRLKADLQSLEQDTKRLSAQGPSEETPGDRVRTHLGDGDRQYLTGLKVGGKRILLLVDASASMLDETIVNIIRRRLLPPASRRRADKWLRAVATVDWLTTQLPASSQFQLFTFDTGARPVLESTQRTWLDAGDREVLDRSVAGLRSVAPQGGTSLYHAFSAIASLSPKPDNIVLLTDGLPTQGRGRPKRATVSSEERRKLFGRALDVLPRGVPVNVILFPIEGDPFAASEFWKLAMATQGSFLSPSEDWP